MRVRPLNTLVFLLSLGMGGVMVQTETARGQSETVFTDSFPILTISRREVFNNVRMLTLNPAATPSVVTFSHDQSGGRTVQRLFEDLILEPATRAAIMATPMPAGGYNLSALATSLPVEFFDVVVLGVDPGGLTFRHRNGLARVPFGELPQEIQRLYGFSGNPKQRVRLANLRSSRPLVEVFNDVRIVAVDSQTNPQTVLLSHSESQGEVITRRIADLQLTAADRATLDANVRNMPLQETVFQTLTVRQPEEFADVAIVRVDPGGLTFQHAESGGKTIRRGFEELQLPDEVKKRLAYKADARIAFRPPDLTTTRREMFRDVRITGFDSNEGLVTFTHRTSSGNTIARQLTELDAAAQAALAGLATPPATTIPVSGAAPVPPVFDEILLSTMTTTRTEVFEDYRVVRVGTNGLTFTHRLDRGVPITRRFEDLPDEVRERYDFKRDREENFRSPTVRLPALRSTMGMVFEDVVILGTDARGLTFRHREGTTKLPFEELPDELREQYDYKNDGTVELGSTTLVTTRGIEFRDVVLLSSDPVGITFRHRDGTTKLPFTDLPEEFRKIFNFNPEDALDFRRAHAVVSRPAPSRRRFLVFRNGYVPAIGAGRPAPGVGFGRGAPAVGSKGIAPAIGISGRVPSIGIKGAVPAVGFPGRTPPVGLGGGVPSIGAGK